MLFNSVHFLLFFPIVTFIYYVIPHKIRWVWLLIASYYFYMSWNPMYSLLIASSTVITYLSGLLISRANSIGNKKESAFLRKLWVFLSFSTNLAILCFFKYFDFLVVNINHILAPLQMEAIRSNFDILLPIGISFYTFQALSYTIDVYRGEISAEKNLAKYALFVSFFPQLVAGPIERARNLLVQVGEKHFFSYDNAKNGLLLMLWGYFQKMIIADHIAAVVNTVYGNHTAYYGFQLAYATFLFAIQIYCDFSGYTDIAKGAAQVMGFRLTDNFRQPYFAASIQDFWRRWHITLSTWFRDYLYIPMGGSRCSVLKKYRNIMVTFLISGLWHGASWTFVIWGGLHGLYQVVGSAAKPLKTAFHEKSKIDTKLLSPVLMLCRILWTFVLVNIAWIFFRSSGLQEAFSIIKTLFFNFGLGSGGMFAVSSYTIGGIGSHDFVMLCVSILVLFVANVIQSKINIRQFLAERNIVFRWLCYYAIVLCIIIFGFSSIGAQQQFIYFQF